MKPTQMLCLDFDNTMIWGHSHLACTHLEFDATDDKAGPGYVVKEADGTFTKYNGESSNRLENILTNGKAPSEAFMNKFIENKLEDTLLKQLKFIQTGPKNPVPLVKIIIDTINGGDKVSIVTFSLYPQIVFKTLEYMFKDVASKEKYLDDICVVTGYPINRTNRKEEHITIAINYFNNEKDIKIDRENCLLVDDDEQNITHAQKNGYKFVVLVPCEDHHNNAYLREIEVMMEEGHPLSSRDRGSVRDILYSNEYKDYLQNLYKQYKIKDKKFDELYDNMMENLCDSTEQGECIREILRVTKTKSDYTNDDLHEALRDVAYSFFYMYIDGDNDSDNDSDSGNDDSSDNDNDSDSDDDNSNDNDDKASDADKVSVKSKNSVIFSEGYDNKKRNHDNNNNNNNSADTKKAKIDN